MTILKQSRSREQYIAMLHNDGAVTGDIKLGKAKIYMEKNGDIKAKEEDPEGQDSTHRCSWGPFSPGVCQRFLNPKWVLFWLCWAGAIQGMVVNGFVNVVISSVERRYDLSSTESGAIASCYDIASVLCLIPVSYFGGLGCKPRYLGIGVLIMGIGSIVFSIPHFTSGLYQVNSGEDSSICRGDNSTLSSCSDSTGIEGLTDYKYVFYLGQLLHGAGAAPLYTLGVTYLDENVPVTSSSLYIGIFYAFAIVGPAVGYLAGGAFLDLYVDVDRVGSDSVTLRATSPRFVGAWWIGFLLSGALAFLVCAPICGFPRALPGSSKLRAEKEKEVYKAKTKKNIQEEDGRGAWHRRFNKIIQSVKILLTNPTFMFLNFAAGCEGNVLAGFATFGPKFIQEQFGLSSAVAAMYVGYVAIPAGGGGTFLGGYLVNRFSLKIKGIIKLCIGVTVPCLLLAAIFFVQCPSGNFAGVNHNYGASSNEISFTGEFKNDACHADCKCSLNDDYNPVCGVDGIIYFTPCHAGCKHVVETEDTLEYYNCSCIAGTNMSTKADAVYGKCESSCSYLPIFLPVFGLLMLLTFIASMPALSATLRCVPQEDRSFALGIQWIIARCLGSIPGPILFGKLIDMSCQLWQNQCGEEGSCFFYSNSRMSYNLLAVGMILKFLSAIFFILSLLCYRGSSGNDDSEDENHSTETEQTTTDQNTLQKRGKKMDNSVDTLATSIHEDLPNNNTKTEMMSLPPDIA